MSGPSREGSRYPPSSRIRRSDEIRTLFRRGKRRRTAHLDVFLAVSPVSRPRIGIVVAKHGHEVTDRNLLKRRLRELGRTRVLPTLWQAGCSLDVLMRTRPEAYAASFAELAGEIDGVVEEICSGQPW